MCNKNKKTYFLVTFTIIIISILISFGCGFKFGQYYYNNIDEKNINQMIESSVYEIVRQFEDKLNVIINKKCNNIDLNNNLIDKYKNIFETKIRRIMLNNFYRNHSDDYIMKYDLKVSENYFKYKKDVSRFIAHAAGIIDGNTYTNSKEALDSSYKKGFRLFELDIIKTIDGKYVAAHDWERWSEITGYKGETPVSREQFLKTKIMNKYTPLDMNAINKWFKEHKDAILVTDKINEPLNFSNVFIDKSRLIMELFDNESINEGLKANILAVMPSQSVVKKIHSKRGIKKLVKKGIKSVAVSRQFIEKNKKLLLELKRNNIKVFAYHVNFPSYINEDYVMKYEMDFIYGIYADEWTLVK
ncbi:MAG: hypothetical protein CSA26_08725 [Desulfobacterales bacterium]|nr:MAG: hypothetical protein CSA26_08725 [Desulfobacterales bacterium]